MFVALAVVRLKPSCSAARVPPRKYTTPPFGMVLSPLVMEKRARLRSGIGITAGQRDKKKLPATTSVRIDGQQKQRNS